jgi:hypothetical protein
MLQFGIKFLVGSRANSLIDQNSANPGKTEINKQHARVAESMSNKNKQTREKQKKSEKINTFFFRFIFLAKNGNNVGYCE